jgi:hypothetical protein
MSRLVCSRSCLTAYRFVAARFLLLSLRYCTFRINFLEEQGKTLCTILDFLERAITFKVPHTMTFSKNSLPSASAPNLGELLRRQRQLQQESTSSAPDNAEESDDPLSSSGLLSFTAATEQLRMQRPQLQHESGSSAQGNEETNNISSSSGLRSFTAAPRGSHPRTSAPRARSMNSLRSILNRAIAVLDGEDAALDAEEVEDSVISSRRDDLNPQQ